MDFGLIESLRWDQHGYLLLERHLKRLEQSAARFGYPFSRCGLLERLVAMECSLTGVHKVRVLLTSDGDLVLEQQEIDDTRGQRPDGGARLQDAAIRPIRSSTTRPPAAADTMTSCRLGLSAKR